MNGFTVGLVLGLVLTAGSPYPGVDFETATGASRDLFIIRGERLLNRPEEGVSGRLSSNEGPRSSLAKICNTASAPGTCGRSFFCPDLPNQTRQAFWRLEAPANPSGPDDWINTNTVVCRNVSQEQVPLSLSAAQFRELPIPPAQINVQPDPAQGATLVYVETNLYTKADQRLLTTTVLGAPVRVRATPARYRWNYGDGETRTTKSPGGAYPDMPTAHVYRQPGKYAVALTTTFTGEFSVSGGPWQPVEGTAAVATEPVTVTAVEAQAHLVP